MTPQNVVLTGFMATGKSSVGKILASRLGYEWVDTDTIIESRYGEIADIFRSEGEAAFRRLERDVAAELANRTGLVISTGGRLLLDADNERALRGSGRIFCLTAAVDEILRRVREQDVDRPLLAGNSPADRIAELLAERADAYARFEQVSTDGRTREEVAEEILLRLDDSPDDRVAHGGSPRPI